MLELINLEKKYGDRIVLDRASLTIEAGEVVALVGANGCGKTTTLRCALGLHHVSGGSVRVDGIDLARDARAARARASYLPQRSEFPSTLTVREILHVVAELRGLPESVVSRELTGCGLQSLSDRTVAKLSGGERQRVALAALLLPDVPVYLLDEPTASLDREGARLLVSRIAALRKAGRAVLFTTHVGADLDRLATRVVRLHQGQFTDADWDEQEEESRAFITVGRHASESGIVGRMHGIGVGARAAAARSSDVRPVRHADFRHVQCR